MGEGFTFRHAFNIAAVIMAVAGVLNLLDDDLVSCMLFLVTAVACRMLATGF